MKLFCLYWKRENLAISGFLILLSLATFVYWKDNYPLKSPLIYWNLIDKKVVQISE